MIPTDMTLARAARTIVQAVRNCYSLRVGLFIGYAKQDAMWITLRPLVRRCKIMQVVGAQDSPLVIGGRRKIALPMWSRETWDTYAGEWIEAGEKMDFVIFGKDYPRYLIPDALIAMLPILSADTIFLMVSGLTDKKVAAAALEEHVGVNLRTQSMCGVTVVETRREEHPCSHRL